MKTEEVTAVQEISIQKGINFLDTGRKHKPNRRQWDNTLNQMKKEHGTFIVAKQARSSISTAAKRLGMKVKTQEIDPYHVRVGLDTE